MSARLMGTCNVVGDNHVASAECTKCDAFINSSAQNGGAWEKAKHWAMRHVCKEDTTSEGKDEE